jgi:5-methylcytosine-specific restriction endonuclease McrA
MSDVLVLNADRTPMSLLPLSVIPWQHSMKLIFQGKVTILDEYENRFIRTVNQKFNMPSVVVANEYMYWERSVKFTSSNLFIRDNMTCQLQITKECKQRHGTYQDRSDLTEDHITPKSYGGPRSWTNIVTACKKCNMAKGNKLDISPIKKPIVPNYYQMVSNRKNLPLRVRDTKWLKYLDWDQTKIIKIGK